MTVCVWLVSLSIVFLEFIHVLAYIDTSLCFMSSIPLDMHIAICLPIYQMAGLCNVPIFWLLFNSAAMNVCVHVLVLVPISTSFGYRIAESYGISVFNYFRNHPIIFQAFYIPTSNV